jgi:meiotically up-regulated gene 157 (Mug157) protein
MQEMIKRVADRLPQYPRLTKMFADTFSNTYSTTLKHQSDASVFVITGDIPAMWLRDSAAQVRPYLQLAKIDPHFAKLIAGVVKRQISYVLLDPYANAFNETANGHCHNKDKTDMSAWIWERKYELDSLCAPLKLAHDLWKATGQVGHLDQTFVAGARLIVETITLELRHENSTYAFERLEGPASDTLSNHGRGSNVMDDANVPSLLAMPYLGYCGNEDETYKATRRFVLSTQNPYFYQGQAASGIGSPHTPKDYIWPIALCMQGLTTNSRAEQLSLLETLMNTEAGTGLMHEGFHKNDPTKFTRPWFAWANSMFAEFVMGVCRV